MKILLFGAKDTLSENIHTYLSTQGYFVDFHHNVAHHTISSYCMHLIDIDISYEIRFHFLIEMKKKFPNVPIIVISADHSIETIQMAFSIGCSDYLKKPFDLKELKIRINRFIKLNYHTPPPSPLIKLSKNYSFNTTSYILLYYEKVQKMTKNELLFLSLLIKKRNQIVNDKEISLYIWNTTSIENTSIRSLVSRIKKKLKEDFIQNIRGFGYMWIDRTH